MPSAAVETAERLFLPAAVAASTRTPYLARGAAWCRLRCRRRRRCFWAGEASTRPTPTVFVPRHETRMNAGAQRDGSTHKTWAAWSDAASVSFPLRPDALRCSVRLGCARLPRHGGEWIRSDDRKMLTVGGVASRWRVIVSAVARLWCTTD
ncbi:unnamed protein product [Phaeothamnion confervicola]